LERSGKITARIYDMLGKNILMKSYLQSEQNNSILSFDIKEFPAGTYFLRLESGGVSTGMTFIKK